MASQVAQIEAVGPYPQPTWQPNLLASPLGRLEHLGDRSKPNKNSFMGDGRSVTPVDLGYSHIGSLNFGSLAITNGPPVSPAPPIKAKTVDAIRPEARVTTPMSEEYHTPYEWRSSWAESSDVDAAGYRPPHFMATQVSQILRSESPLKQEARTRSNGSVELEQVPEPRTLYRLSKQAIEPVVRLAELINADESDLLDLETETPDVSGIYSHSRHGSTHSAISLASQYIADIPASPFEGPSPKLENREFVLEPESVQHEPMGHTRKPSRGNVTVEIGVIEIPVKKRPSQSQSDDSGYSSASASHHAHDQFFGPESAAPGHNEYLGGHEPASPA